MAVGALRELRERGLRVPEDVSVTGFDNVNLAQFCYPALTTVHIPRDQIGRTICECLMNRENVPARTGVRRRSRARPAGLDRPCRSLSATGRRAPGASAASAPVVRARDPLRRQQERIEIRVAPRRMAPRGTGERRAPHGLSGMGTGGHGAWLADARIVPSVVAVAEANVVSDEIALCPEPHGPVAERDPNRPAAVLDVLDQGEAVAAPRDAQPREGLLSVRRTCVNAASASARPCRDDPGRRP